MHQLDILCHQAKLPVPGMDCNLLNCCPRGSHGNPQTSQAIVKATGYFTPDDKDLLLKTTFIHAREHREVYLVPD